MSVPFLVTLLSLNAVLVIVERVSPTTKIILQPYSFLRVHEVFQMGFVIMLSIIISFLLLKVISHNFETLKTPYGTFLGILFSLGIYFTASGNGLHEVASHLFHTFCNTRIVRQDACGSMFFNDYYTGNVIYFVGLLLGNVSLILLERLKPLQSLDRRNLGIVFINAAVYALTLFLYAAFDRVLVGFYFVVIAAIVCDFLLVTAQKKFTSLPFTLYTALAYSAATVLTLLVRFGFR